MRRALVWAALAAVAAFSLAVAAQPGPPLDPEEKVTSVASGLRCPVCQGLSVADSHSPTAEAMYDDIRRRVEAGESDAAIKGYYVSRYGEWVLLKPEASGVGVVVWLLPLSALLLGAGGLAVAFRRWRRQPARSATDEDRALVEAALARREEEAP